MSAGVLAFTGDLALQTNSSFVYTLTWLDANQQPVNLTGYEAKMSIGDTIPPTTIYATLESTGMSPVITFNASAGQILISWAQSAVAAAFDSYLINGTLNVVYDLLLYPPENPEFNFLQGPMQVNAGVTSA